MIIKFCCARLKDDYIIINNSRWSQIFIYRYCPYCGKEIQFGDVKE